MDVFAKIKRNMGPLGQYAEQADGYFVFPKLEEEIAPRMKFRGKEVLNWSLNNYLGLANHPEVRATDARASEKWGLGYPMGARAMSGHTRLHEVLEEHLAEFEHKEAAYLLNYGYQGMVSIIDSLLDRKDVAVYDSEAHACILDGLRMHIGKRFVYPHNNIESLEKQLQRAEKIVSETGGGTLVITEGVFGMSGDLGKLDQMVALKSKYHFRILLDDAHGFGTMGKTGAGTAEHLGVQEGIDLYFGTFAKAMALIGGFVAGLADVITFLRYNMRSQIFAKSLPMPIVEGAIKRLEMLRNQPELKDQLWKIVDALQSGLRSKGFNLGSAESPVTPVFLSGTPAEASNLVFDLRENYNIFCSIVVYPVVPKDVIMLRLIPTAAHSLEDVDYTIKAFSEIAEKLKNKAYDTVNLAVVR